VFTGDVVEHRRDFYGAFGDLSDGVARLKHAGIRVLGVAGNHDYEILPALARDVDGFELLGVGGHWEGRLIDGPDATVELLGWSFNRETAPDPLPAGEQLPERLAPDTPRVGLLHCDRDGQAGQYAPVRSSALEAAQWDGWLLGHIHKPDPMEGGPPKGYLGSVVGLDPTEDGAHGPWLLLVEPGGRLRMTQVILAPLRWVSRDLDVTELGSAEELLGFITADLRALDQEVRAESTVPPRAVGCRYRFTGRTNLRNAFAQELERAELSGSPTEISGVVYFVDAWRFETQPPIDLAACAEQSDPVGLLARRLLALEDPGSPIYQELVPATLRRLEATARHNAFARLQTPYPTEAEAVAYLHLAGLEALDRLIHQQDAG